MEYKLYKEKKIRRESPEKRVELGLHTNFSPAGFFSVRDLLHRAAEFGHSAAAVTDLDTVQAFPDASWGQDILGRGGHGLKVIYGMEADLSDFLPFRACRLTLLVKDEKGLRNLYKLVTWAHLENTEDKTPCLTKEKIASLREGLIVGCAGTKGELFEAIESGASDEKIEKIAAFYDYIGIRPAHGSPEERERIKKLNRRALKIGEKLDIPVCAVGNVYYSDPEDKVVRDIWTHVSGSDVIEATGEIGEEPDWLFTTEEMLEEFSYLGESEAYKVVVTNTNLIADRIAEVSPVAREFLSPSVPGAKEEICSCVRERAVALYGDPLPEEVSSRIETEMKAISDHGFFDAYAVAKRLTDASKANGWPYAVRGASGSSLTAFFAGITAINPLPAHYRCPECRRAEFVSDEKIFSGFDLEDKLCPVCGSKMQGDGHDIPYETFASFYKDKSPDFDLLFSAEHAGDAKKYLSSLFGDQKVFSLGTVEKLSREAAEKRVKEYAADFGLELGAEETDILASYLAGKKTFTRRWSGRAFVIPSGLDPEDFTPLQYPDNDKERKEICSHFDCRDLFGLFIHTGVQPHPALDLLARLEKITGVKADLVPMNDPGVFKSFSLPEDEETLRLEAALKVPFSTDFSRRLASRFPPAGFGDLVRIAGLSLGTNTWTGNGEELTASGVCGFGELITSRDDIALCLIKKGVDAKMAFSIMEDTRRGRAAHMRNFVIISSMRSHGVPEWYIESIKKIRYLAPKAFAVGYAGAAVRLAWYRLHYPEEYSAALPEVLSENPGSEDVF